MHTAAGRPLRPRGPGRRRRRHRLARRHRRQQRQPADGRAARAAPGRHHERLPADLSRRPARRRGAAARAGRHAVPRHQGGARRERRLPAGGGARRRRNGGAGQGRRGQPDAHRHARRPGRAGRPAAGHRGSGRPPTAGTWRCAPTPTPTSGRWPAPTSPAPWRPRPVRIPLPDSPQGEAISFAADNRTCVVASEGLPSDVTVVPLAAVPVAAAPPRRRRAPCRASTDLTSSGLSPITSALIAAARRDRRGLDRRASCAAVPEPRPDAPRRRGRRVAVRRGAGR